METSRKRIRREFAPLTVSVAIACDSAYSPLMQVYDAQTGEYEPNRQLSPTVIRPEVNAVASDGSWPNHSANKALANLKWYVNGVNITTLSAWTGKYTIETEGDNRGSIIITKNITPGTNFSLHFEADLVDQRLGVTIPIRTDAVVLSTIDKAEDNYAVSIGETNTIRYNPFLDKLHEYDYKVAHGIISASAAAEAAAKDGNEYKRTIPIQVYKGGLKLESGFTVKLYKVASNLTLTEVTSSDYEVVSVSASAVVLDLRLITKQDFIIKAFVSSTEVAKLQFSVNRLYPSFTCEPTNETGILPQQIERYDVAQAQSDGKILAYPGNVLQIIWKTDSINLTNVIHNEGGTTVFDLRKTGVGEDYTNDWVDVYVEASQKAEHCVATDGGNILTDESGNILIFN